MTIVLGGITLNPDMIWREQFVAQSVAQSTRRTLGGALVVYSGKLQKGDSITLSASESNGTLIGVLRKSVVDSLLALAAVPGAQYVLTRNGENFNVIFDPPGVDMVPIQAKPGHQYAANDLMRGDIKLLTV